MSSAFPPSAPVHTAASSQNLSQSLNWNEAFREFSLHLQATRLTDYETGSVLENVLEPVMHFEVDFRHEREFLSKSLPQCEHSMREVFNGLRWRVRTGASWRMIPNELPPWHTVYQQSVRSTSRACALPAERALYQQSVRWIKAECFIALVHDLRELLRVAQGRAPQPTAAVFDGRTVQSTPESGARAGYNGAKRRKGSKVHIAADTLGHLLALHVTPANVDQDYTGPCRGR